MLEILIALLVTVVVSYFVLKGYQAQATLMAGGILLMFLALILGTGMPLPAAKSTGSQFLDTFQYIKNTLAEQSAGLGLKIMAIAGFAMYMQHIGASAALVKVLTKPLEKIRHKPYLFMALCFLVGEFLSIFITSASGLGVLLMVTLYPLMRGVGLSPLTSCTPIATAVAVEMGPAQGNVNFAADIIGIHVVEYVVKYQIWVSLASLFVIASLLIVVNRYLDTKDPTLQFDDLDINNQENQNTLNKAPTIYAILPIIPLVLIFMFNKLTISSIEMDVTTAMLISVVIALTFEYIATRKSKEVVNSIQVFFDGMGRQFANVVTFLVAGQVFAEGLKAIGAIDMIIHSAETAGFGAVAMTIVMVIIIMITSVIMGSGNSAFFSFANLVPEIARHMGIAPIMMLLPMQFVAGMARNISPIAPNVVAVAGVANISPIALAKRTTIPMLGGIIISTVISLLSF